MQSQLNLALIQTNVLWENIEQNIANFNAKIDSLSSNIDLVILPEMFATGFSMQPQNCAESMDGMSVMWMKETAIKKQIAIVGSLIIKENEHYYNRLLFVYPTGEMETYDKRHLFSYGGEDKMYSAGNKRLIVNYKGWKICPLICYDLRFPVWSRNTANFDILIYVANWPKPRINAWDALLKARAIENICYTIGVNRVGEDANNLEYIGHSQVNDMLGNEIAKSQVETETIIECALDKNLLNKTRNKLQFLNDKDSFSIEE